MNNDAGLILNIDGFGDFTAAIKQLDKVINGLDVRFGKIAAGLNAFGEALDTKPLKTFSDALDANLLNNLEKMRELLNNFKPGTNLTKLGTTMTSFSSVVRDFSAAADGFPGKINLVISALKDFFGLLSARSKSLDAFSRSISNFGASQESVQRIAVLYNQLRPPTTVDKIPSLFGRVRQSLLALGEAAHPIRGLAGALEGFQTITVRGFFGGGVGSKIVQLAQSLAKASGDFEKFSKALGAGRLALRNFYDFIRAVEELSKLDVGQDSRRGFLGIFGNQSATGLTAQFQRLGAVLDKTKATFGGFANAIQGGAGGLRAFQPFVNALRELSQLQVTRTSGGIMGFIRGGMADQVQALGRAFMKAAPGLYVFGAAIAQIAPNFGQFRDFAQNISSGKLTAALREFYKLQSNIVGTPAVKVNKKQGENILGSFLSSFMKEAIKQSTRDFQEEFYKSFTKARYSFTAKEFTDVGREIAKGLAQGIVGKGVPQTVISLFAAYIRAARDVFKVRSPSQVFREIGEQVVAGFGLGLKAIGGLGIKIAGEFVNGFRNALNSLPGIIKSVLDGAANQFTNLGNNIRNSGRNMIQTGLQQVVSGGLVGFVQGQAMAQVASFDQAMNQIRIFGNLATDELGTVRQEILNFSKDTIFDPQQSATAFLGLQKAGLSVQQSLQALPEIGNLAAAGQLELAEATQAVIQASQIYGISIEDSVRITDGYVRAANNSTAEVRDLSAALGNVGPLAEQFGLSFEQTLAVIAQFQARGVTGAEAGTQLKSMLISLTNPSERVTNAFASLGVSLTDTNGQIRPLNDLINDLNKAMNESRTVTRTVSNLTEEQAARLDLAQDAYARASRQLALYNDGLTTGAVNNANAAKQVAKYQGVLQNAEAVIAEITGSQEEAATITEEITRSQIENFRTIQDLAGSFGGVGLSILLGSDEDAINSFVEEMETLPSAAEIAAEMMATFAGRAESLKGSIQTLIINALSPLQNKVLVPLFDGLINVVNALASLPEPVLAAAGGFVLLGTALVTLNGVFSIAGGIILSGFGGAMATIGGLISGVTAVIFNPLGLLAGMGAIATTALTVIPIIAAVGIGLVAAFTAVTSIVRDIQNNVGGAGEAFAALTSSIGGLFGEIVGIVREIISAFQGIRTEVDDTAVLARGTGLAQFFDGIREKVEAIRSALEGVRRFIGVFNAVAGNPSVNENSSNALLQRRSKLLDQIAEKQATIAESAGEAQKVNIEAGDTLSALAQEYGTTVDELMRLNNLEPGDFIIAGQELTISAGVEVDDAELTRLKDEVEALDVQIANIPVEDPVNRVRRAVDAFSETDLFARIFGSPDAASKERVVSTITDVLTNLQNIKGEIPKVVGAFQQMFTGDITGGFETLRSSVGNIGREIREIFSSLGGASQGPTLSSGALVGFLPANAGQNPFRSSVDRIRTQVSEAFSEVKAGDFSSAVSSISTALDEAMQLLNFSNPLATLSNKMAGLRQQIAGVLNPGRQSNAALAAEGAVNFASAGTLTTAISDSLLGIDTGSLQTTFEQHFTDILGIVGTAAGIIFGGPVGIVIGAGKLLATAIQNDFLGIGTLIDQSGIRTALEGVFNGIVTTIQDVFGGGGGQSDQALAEAFAMGAVQAPTESNPILDTINMLVNGIKKGVEIFTPELQASFDQIATGVSGFFENLSKADTSGIDNIIAFILKVGGVIAGVASTVILIGTDILSNIFENVLPKVGDAVAGLVSALSALGNGDPVGILNGIRDAVSGVINVFAGITAGVADGILAFIEKITGLELPDTAGTIQSIQDTFGMIPTIVEGIALRVASAFNDVAVGIRVGVRDLKQGILDAAAQIGAAGALVGLDSGLVQSSTLQSQAISIAETLESDLNASVDAGGPIQIDLPQIEYITQDLGPGSEAFQAVVDNIADPLLIQQAINTAVEQGDVATVEALLPIAAALDLDVETVKQDGVALGEAVIAGATEGMADPDGTVIAASETVADNVMTPMETALETNSPSQWALRVGQYVLQGLIQGMNNLSLLLAQTVTTITQTALQQPIVTMLMYDGAQSLWAFNVGAAFGQSLATGLQNRIAIISITANTVIQQFQRMELSIDRMMKNVTHIITTQIDRMLKSFDQFKTGVQGVATVANSVNATGSFAQVQGNWTGGIHRAGLGWVGERGPELMFTNRDMAVLNNRTSLAFAAGADFGAKFGGFRREGGQVDPGRFYQIIEDGLPEIFRDKQGRVFLLPGTSGYVSPMERGGGTTSVDSSTNVYINYQGNGLSAADLEAIRSASAQGVEEAKRGDSFSRRALTRGMV